MSRFNLIDEPWIAVRFPDGSRAELGIKETLLRAKEIAVIEDPSPLVVAALHRFLLAVLYRALEGPTDIDQAKGWFKAGLPADKITSYLERWRDRFWLFGEKHPFGQNPNVPEKEIEPWTKLTAEHNATSNKVLFDHVDTKAPGAKSFAECTRWLVSTMTFSLSGGRGYFPSPSVNGLMCIPIGANLHETLCYCLVDQNRAVLKGDVPLWEHDAEKLPIAPPKRSPKGNADLYSWPARMVLLEESAASGVAYVRFIAGLGSESSVSFTDPMLAYTYSKEKGRYAVPFRDGRGTWRDFDSLLPGVGGDAPLTIQHSIKLANRDSRFLPKSVLVLGLRYTPPNANVDFWRMERFALPEALVSNKEIREDIRQLLSIAEDAGSSLRSSLWTFHKSIMAHGDRDLTKQETEVLKKTVASSSVLQGLWSNMEAFFQDILLCGTPGLDPDEIRRDWLISVRSALRDAWAQFAASVSTGDAWAIRALVRAEDAINRKLTELSTEIRKYEPQEETA